MISHYETYFRHPLIVYENGGDYSITSLQQRFHNWNNDLCKYIQHQKDKYGWELEHICLHGNKTTIWFLKPKPTVEPVICEQLENLKNTIETCSKQIAAIMKEVNI